MSELVVPAVERKHWPSLGGQVCDFIEQALVFGPGDLRGEPAVIDDEKRALIWRAYEVYPKGHEQAGRRRFKRVGISLAKGLAKTELAAWIAACELHPDAPVRCDGFDKRGHPIGAPVRDPYIPMVAYTEEQSDELAYGTLRVVLEEGPLADDFDIGLERILRRRGDGKAVSLSAAPNARDGARTTFQVADEPLALDTPVPTPVGWKTMGELCEGDQVFGRDGRVCNVVGVSPVHEGRPCYRLTFSDRSSIVADEGHRWFVHRRGGCGHGQGCRCEQVQGWATRSTKELLDTQHGEAYTYHVPLAGALSLPDKALPIDPYFLGYWLGDGDSRNATVAVGREDVDEITGHIESLGYTVTPCAVGERTPLLYVTFKDSRFSGWSATDGKPHNRSVVGTLRGLSLLENKHIPAEYLRGSLVQRLALVQGLMDSDGHVAESGSCTFISTTPALVEGMTELLRSIGCPPSVHWREDARKDTYRPVAKVTFQGDQSVFRLARKRTRLSPRTRTFGGARAIVSVEPVDSVPVRCIAVDSLDHLYLAGEGMVPTHNTHWWTLPRLKQAHQTMMANLPKRRMADAWALEVTTAPEPGAGSVAEDTMEYAKAVAAGQMQDSRLFFFHREASEKHDLETEEGARAAVLEASGPNGLWRDIDGIVELWRDPTTDRRYWERVWCNRLVQASAQAFDVDLWKRLVRDSPVKDGDRITLGFDGAIFRDSTGLVATHLETGYQFVLGVWERPYNAPDDWQVPEQDVDDAVCAAFERYNVLRMYADPPYWQAWIAKWSGQFGAERALEWWTNRRLPMTRALEAFDTAMRTGTISHDGDPVLARHIGNARKKALPQRDESGRSLWLIEKERSDSPMKIDLCMAAVLSNEARNDAIAKGALNEVHSDLGNTGIPGVWS